MRLPGIVFFIFVNTTPNHKGKTLGLIFVIAIVCSDSKIDWQELILNTKHYLLKGPLIYCDSPFMLNTEFLTGLTT